MKNPFGAISVTNFFMAKGLQKIKEPLQDDMEKCEVVFIKPETVIKDILNGKMPCLSTAMFIAIATNPNFTDIR